MSDPIYSNDEANEFFINAAKTKDTIAMRCAQKLNNKDKETRASRKRKRDDNEGQPPAKRRKQEKNDAKEAIEAEATEATEAEATAAIKDSIEEEVTKAIAESIEASITVIKMLAEKAITAAKVTIAKAEAETAIEEEPIVAEATAIAEATATAIAEATIFAHLGDPYSNGLDAHNNYDFGATFAVWNLWDLGGGPRANHWDEEALEELPDELINIKADVLGLLEIKTGKPWQQIPKERYYDTAFEIGVMTGLIFNLVERFDYLRGIEEFMWVGEDSSPLLEGLNLWGIPEPDEPLDMENQNVVLKEVMYQLGDIIKYILENKNIYHNMYNIMKWACYLNQHNMESSMQKFDTGWYLDLENRRDSNLYPNQNQLKRALKSTWKEVQKAFENAGAIQILKETPQAAENNGKELIEDTLGKLTADYYKSLIIEEVEGDGETTAFLYDSRKFEYKNHGPIRIKGNGWRFRSAGYVLLRGRSGVLNNENVLVVAWHAPSENHVGYRQQAYTRLNNEIRKLEKLSHNAEVVLLADMNIRSYPAACEDGIIEEAYSAWLPEAGQPDTQNGHMYDPNMRTSLKMKGTSIGKWNHPFDKVLLLKKDENKFEIGEYFRGFEDKCAKEVRIFSDHCWVRAEINPIPQASTSITS